MSCPVSIQDGLYSTNTLASKKFLLVYLLIIWGSLLAVIIEIYFFWILVKGHFTLMYFLLPFKMFIIYLTIIII